MERVYLGSSRLDVELPPGFCREHSDFERFSAPCLPVEHRWRIAFSPADRLEIPEGEPVFRAPEYLVFRQADGGESRAYRSQEPGGEVFYALTRRDSGGATISYVPGRFNWHSPFNQIWGHCFLESLLLDGGAMILHSVYYEYQGQAILFTAPSGTGKTTHAELWERYVGGRQVNGDRTLIQRSSAGEWYACGFPIHGTSPHCHNEALPIRAIVVLRQARENRVIPLSPMEQIQYLYSETTVNNWREDFVNQVLELTEQLTAAVPVVKLECNMKPDAAFVLRDYLFPGGSHGRY